MDRTSPKIRGTKTYFSKKITYLKRNKGVLAPPNNRLNNYFWSVSFTNVLYLRFLIAPSIMLGDFYKMTVKLYIPFQSKKNVEIRFHVFALLGRL